MVGFQLVKTLVWVLETVSAVKDKVKNECRLILVRESDFDKESEKDTENKYDNQPP